MQAIRPSLVRAAKPSAADRARLLLEANQDYQRSNDATVTAAQRLLARQRAQQMLQDLLQTAPEDGDALGLLGRIAMDEGRLDAAFTHFTASIQAQPHNAQLVTNLGYWALLKNLPAAAEGYFNQALALDRQSAAAFCGIAHAKRASGQFDSAYLHYRSLLKTGLAWPSVYAGMLACAEQLTVTQTDDALVADAIALLQRDELPHQKLAHFVAKLLRDQYQLDDPAAQIDIDHASDDLLLKLALERTLLPDAAVEELVTLLRQSITLEVASSGSLRDSLQGMAIHLATYAERTGYALLISEDEAHFVRQLNDAIHTELSCGGGIEDLAGAVIISAMYGALFNQSFATALGRFDLHQWPTGMQTLLRSSYFNKAIEEDFKQGFVEKEQELVIAEEDRSHPWPNWQNLSHHNVRSLKADMVQQFAMDSARLPALIRVLVIGATSGQRALEIARYFNDVEVIAVDEELANIAHASRRAQDMGLDNVLFWPWSLASRFIQDGHQVHLIELGRLPSKRLSGTNVDRLVRSALASGGIIHVNTALLGASPADQQMQALVQHHKLSPTMQNVRRLRSMVLKNQQDARWAPLLTAQDFYATAGCRSRWFFPEDTAQISALLNSLSSEVDWKLIKVRDEDDQELATAPVLNELQAQRMGNSVRGLIGQNLSLYFQRRR